MKSKKRKAKKIKKQVNKIKMILCLVVEAIVILTLVVIIGWSLCRDRLSVSLR